MLRVLRKVLIPIFLLVFTQCVCFANANISTVTLQKIAGLPAGSITTSQKILEMFLVDMGYPKDLITITYLNSDSTAFEGDIIGGAFYPSSGKLKLNSRYLQANNGILASTIRHELDHFQKAAQICKSIGLNKYEDLFSDSNEPFNRIFWQRAMQYTNVQNFDTKKYLNAMTKYSAVSDPTSVYSVFSSKTDAVRNPLEISAYAYSDAIEKYFKIPPHDTTVKTIAIAFNKIDWQIYNITRKYPSLYRSKVAVFDYFYLLALIESDPYLRQAYQAANKNGAIKEFWGAVKNSTRDLYSGNTISKQTVDKVVKLLNRMSVMMNQGISIKQTGDIFRLKYLSLKQGVQQGGTYKGNLIILLSKNVDDYLKYASSYGVSDDYITLNLYLTKIQLLSAKVVNSSGKVIFAPKYTGIPAIENKIYNNKAFKQELKKRNMADNFTNGSNLLKILIGENRL